MTPAKSIQRRLCMNSYGGPIARHLRMVRMNVSRTNEGQAGQRD